MPWLLWPGLLLLAAGGGATSAQCWGQDRGPRKHVGALSCALRQILGPFTVVAHQIVQEECPGIAMPALQLDSLSSD